MKLGPDLPLVVLCRVDLELIKRTGTDHQKWMASKVEPVGQQITTFAYFK